jgi:ribosomal protein S20
LDLALPLLANSGVRAEAEIAVKKIAEAVKAQHPKAAQEALNRLQPKLKAE